MLHAIQVKNKTVKVEPLWKFEMLVRLGPPKPNIGPPRSYILRKMTKLCSSSIIDRFISYVVYLLAPDMLLEDL